MPYEEALAKDEANGGVGAGGVRPKEAIDVQKRLIN
jgi:hypothetical protein